MDIYSLAFSVSNLGPIRYKSLLKKFGKPKKAWEGSVKEYESLGIVLKTFKTFDDFRNSFIIESYVTKLEKEKVEFISYLDELYPESLKKLNNPPIGLFVKGNKKLLKTDVSIAVVGTRKVTEYGRSVTESIVEGLVRSGVCIISGLALGVDAIAQRSAVKNNGSTIAVLACGVDCCLPSENYSLYSDILKNNGLIISEYPLSQPPNKGTFLARNRIVAALSQGVLVPEAATGSGSLVTAEYGLKLQKKVFAVPGPITSRMSDGSLQLLKQGATLVTEAEDILSGFKIQNSKGKSESRIYESLKPEEREIVELLEVEEMTIDEIAKITKIKTNNLMGLISGLELRGIIKNKGGNIRVVMSGIV